MCFCSAACDSCVVVLLVDLEKMDDEFHSAAAQLSSLNASSMAWAQLRNLNKSVEDIAVSVLTLIDMCNMFSTTLKQPSLTLLQYFKSRL